MSKPFSTTISHRRGAEFTALHLLPWDTEAVVSGNVPEVLSQLESALQEREQTVKSVELQFDAKDPKLNIKTLRRLLSNDSKNVEKPSAAHFTAFVQQLCVYRLFDVTNRLSGNPQSVALHGRQPFSIRRSFYKHMNDWTQHVHRLVHSLEEISNPSSTQVIRTESATPDAHSWNMLHDINRAVQNEEAAMLKSNILVAAFYLRYMLAGNLDLPQDINQVYTSLSESTALQIPHDWPKGKEKTQKMRLPLQMALTISPLCLLIPVRLSKHDVSREELVLAWQSLGNGRPQVIIQAENKLWDLLFLVAREEVDLESKLALAMHEIASLISTTTEEEKKWFIQDNELEESPSFLTRQLKVISCPDDWPNHHRLAITGGGPGGSNDGEEERPEDEIQDEAGVPPEGHGPNDGEEERPEDEIQDEAGVPPEGHGPNDGDSSPRQTSEEAAEHSHPPTQSSHARPRGLNVPRIHGVASKSKRKRTPVQYDEDEDKDCQLLQHIEVIDLTNEWDVPRHTLPLTNDSKPSPLAQEWRMFGTVGTAGVYKSPLPHDIDQIFLNSVVKSLEISYVNDKPRHWCQGSDSAFFFIDQNSFERLQPQELQDIFQKQHIVVTGIPQKGTIQFDRRGLETLGAWKQLRTLQDLTTAIHDGDYSRRLFQGSLKDLWQHASSPNGRVINALDLPLLHAEAPDPRLASNIKAWSDTIQLPLWNKVEFPTQKMQWGIASTCGTQHLWRIDSEGVATAVEVKAGRKWWVVAQPKDRGRPILNLNDEKDWMWDPAASNSRLWDCEAILLSAGMRIIMKPNTPHMVITPEHTICHGSHFISTATLRATCHGILHSFVQRHIYTNTENREVWYSLLRLLLFYRAVYLDSYLHDPGKPAKANSIVANMHLTELDRTHIPKCDKIPGLFDLLTFLAVMELGLALFPGTYDAEGIGAKDWLRFNQGKSAVCDIVSWLDSNFEVFGEAAGKPIKAVYGAVLLHISMVLISYKEKSVKEKYGKRNVPFADSTSAVLYEVIEALAKHPELDACIASRSGLLTGTFDISNDFFRSIRVKPMAEDGNFSGDALRQKPELDMGRFHTIKRTIQGGSWPKPRIAVEEFLGIKEIEHFPFDIDSPGAEDAQSGEDGDGDEGRVRDGWPATKRRRRSAQLEPPGI